jgi:DnaJ-domain-containing protein 1
MTEALRQVMEEIQQLDPALQDEVATRIKAILKELEEEHEWEAMVSTPESQALLAKLKARAQEQIEAGEVYDLDEIL